MAGVLAAAQSGFVTRSPNDPTYHNVISTVQYHTHPAEYKRRTQKKRPRYPNPSTLPTACATPRMNQLVVCDLTHVLPNAMLNGALSQLTGTVLANGYGTEDGDPLEELSNLLVVGPATANMHEPVLSPNEWALAQPTVHQAMADGTATLWNTGIYTIEPGDQLMVALLPASPQLISVMRTIRQRDPGAGGFPAYDTNTDGIAIFWPIVPCRTYVPRMLCDYTLSDRHMQATQPLVAQSHSKQAAAISRVVQKANAGLMAMAYAAVVGVIEAGIVEYNGHTGAGFSSDERLALAEKMGILPYATIAALGPDRAADAASMRRLPAAERVARRNPARMAPFEGAGAAADVPADVYIARLMNPNGACESDTAKASELFPKESTEGIADETYQRAKLLNSAVKNAVSCVITAYARLEKMLEATRVGVAESSAGPGEQVVVKVRAGVAQ